MQDRAYYQSLLGNENVQRALATIRAAEGTQRYADPYATGFGGYQIDDMSWHPGVSRPFTGTTGRRQRTTAAGAYQFLNRTWNNVANALGLDDFSQENQDIAAVALMDDRGALDNVLAGDVEGFTNAVNREWASMPGSPYDQRTRSRGFINRAWNEADPGIMSAMFDAPTPEAAPRWETAVPGAVERAELEGVPSGLLGPSVTPAQGYGQLAATMGETPALNLAGAVPASPMDRMSAAPVAQGLDGLRAGLLSQQPGSMYASQQQMADMQDRANLINDVNEMRGHVTPQSAGLLSFAESTPSPSPAAAAIETAAPAQPSTAALVDAYGGLGQSLYDGGVLGLSGQKLYDPNSLTEKLIDQTPVGPGLLSSAPVQQQPAQEMGDYTDPQVSVQGPASQTIETSPTPPADVGSFPAAPQTTGQKATKIAGRVAGALLGSAAAGPIGGLLGGMLGNEMASGKGLFSGSSPQSIGGLLSSLGSSVNNIGRGSQQSYSVWGGGTPMGTQATATDGSRITSLGNGMIARTDRNGVTTTFNDRGNIVGSPVSTGGLFSGIGRDIADAFGGGSSSGGTGGVDTSGMSPGLW